MGFERVSILLAQERSVPSADEWDAARSEEFGIVTGGGAQRDRPLDAVMLAVQEMHWVSVACFLEQRSPTELSLIPELAARVTVECAQLRAFDPLEAYAASLEVLCKSSDADTKHGQPTDVGGLDAAH